MNHEALTHYRCLCTSENCFSLPKMGLKCIHSRFSQDKKKLVLLIIIPQHGKIIKHSYSTEYHKLFVALSPTLEILYGVQE